MPYWLASRLNGFVEQCYWHKTKKPGFNGLASPREGRVQGGLQLGTVEVVFDQLLSAWLGVNRWTNYSHVHINSCITALRKTWEVFSNPIKVTFNFNPDLDPKLSKTSTWRLIHCVHCYHLKVWGGQSLEEQGSVSTSLLQYFISTKPPFNMIQDKLTVSQ